MKVVEFENLTLYSLENWPFLEITYWKTFFQKFGTKWTSSNQVRVVNTVSEAHTLDCRDRLIFVSISCKNAIYLKHLLQWVSTLTLKKDFYKQITK